MIQDILLQSNILPDPAIRFAIRILLNGTLKKQKRIYQNNPEAIINNLINKLQTESLAIETEKANEQHYEVPPLFFQKVLGKYLKYSAGLWSSSTDDLDQSEKNMLDLYLLRSQVKNGQKILDLGCGWGSLSLYLAEKFPDSNILGISNSANQKKFIDQEISNRKLHNLTILTEDINTFSPEEKFDRILSVEMFEHIRNYKHLFEKLHLMLNPEGLLFIHIFAHKSFAYHFDVEPNDSWMARTFFSGGTMPSENMLPLAASTFKLNEHWIVSGINYKKTLEAWLVKMDSQKESIIPILKETYGSDYKKWWIYWRVFFISCAETFGFKQGNEWRVNHYLFSKK